MRQVFGGMEIRGAKGDLRRRFSILRRIVVQEVDIKVVGNDI